MSTPKSLPTSSRPNVIREAFTTARTRLPFIPPPPIKMRRWPKESKLGAADVAALKTYDQDKRFSALWERQPTKYGRVQSVLRHPDGCATVSFARIVPGGVEVVTVEVYEGVTARNILRLYDQENTFVNSVPANRELIGKFRPLNGPCLPVHDSERMTVAEWAAATSV